MSSKYPQGYLHKIQYWQYKVNRFINEGDLIQAEYAIKKLAYFTARQVVVENQTPYIPNVAGTPVDLEGMVEVLTYGNQ